MSRYSSIPYITSTNNPKRRYINVKYPEITKTSNDIYVYTAQGDRYDLLALQYYNDSDLWWVISRANPSQPSDSLYPNFGEQIRIPAPSTIPTILANYASLNK